MRIILEDNNKLLTFELDSTAKSYWITDGQKNNLVNVENEDNKWTLKSNNYVKIINDNISNNSDFNVINHTESVELLAYKSINIYEVETKRVRKIYCLPTYDKTMQQFILDPKTNSFVIGNNDKALINCKNSSFVKEQILFEIQDNTWVVTNKNPKVNLYINDVLQTKPCKFNNGDMCFIDGFMITLVWNIILFNNPNNIIQYDMKLIRRTLPINPVVDYSLEHETYIETYSKNEYFQRPPRFKRNIEPKKIEIVPPTASFNKEEMPLIYTLGPMLLMGVTSVMYGFNAISNVLEGKSTFKENATSIITSCSMVLSMLVFPLLQKFYTKNNIRKKEKKRKTKYTKYINGKKEQILQEIETQRQILIENNLNLETVYNVVINKQRNLWERKIEHTDFLEMRIGLGNVRPQIEVNLPGEEFTIEEEDSLKELYNQLIETVKDMDNVPVTIDFKSNNITGIVGNYDYVMKFLSGLLLNLMAFHSSDMLKLVVFTSNEKKINWEKYRNIPHFWDNERNSRFIGIDIDSINKVSNNLMQIYNERKSFLEENNKDESSNNYLNFKEYYLIISDESDYLKNTTIFNELKKSKNNIGFSFIIITERIDSLPNECTKFINISPEQSGIFETELISNKQKTFIADIPNIDLKRCYLTLSNIPVDISAGKFLLPKNYSFLEMYNVGNVKHLNILNRWKNNNIIQSLSAPVGINEQGELLKIDLHEKAHGPHGLVAGMTGSGKSEWIITYILSMCINYHPNEVQFVLIDYKGGGLAGTFENKETGIKIPHLAGTITNLDVSEINRSLASINSELKRRQNLFNQARDKLGESSVDIYKYQKWYRENKIDTPISHLFIISDEFAELKAQQPEFMSELISTARIGRSLGVHLILATQKPSGVVDDQIWSNSKFKVCLKVQDTSDSNEMIRIPDAAMLKETGRFYLQVGFNEYFAKGQSAYAGMPYYESDRHKKNIDTDVIFVDNTGEIYKEINSEKKVEKAVFKGEELSNIIKEIISVASSENIESSKLWLDAIPEKIYIDELLKKYEYKKQNYIINPIIGEYDAPQYQKQGLLTLPISKDGNVLIYGIPGSGKEKLITTLLYSLMITHVANEVNVYVADFGSEVFNCFKKSPIVGDILDPSDPEKLKNYFKFINKEFQERKKLFSEYNADYYTYIKNSKNTKPVLINIINNYENFSEMYGDTYFDLISKLARDGEKYGIYFIIAANAISSISFRLTQYFKQSVCLQQKDPYDYKNILGVKTVVPANKKGRGVILINKEAFEFQTADPLNTEELSVTINELSKKFLEKSQNKAPKIKSLPESITYNFVKDYIVDFTKLPIGIEVNDIEVYQYNFLNQFSNIITSSDLDILIPYVESLLKMISLNSDKIGAIVIDSNNLINKIKDIKYITSDFKENLVNLSSEVKDLNQVLIFFVNINTLFKGNPELIETLNTMMKEIKVLPNINIVHIEEINNLREIGYNEFFNNYASNENAIFVGNGLENQFIFKLKGNLNELRQSIPENYGYVISKGKIHKIKLLEISDEE